MKAAAPHRADALDCDALAAWLADIGAGAGDIREVRVLTGGTQNLILRFSFDNRNLVLRSPPVGSAAAAKLVAREAKVLSALAGSDVPHPRFVGFSEDTAIIGGPFVVTDEVDGFNAVEEMPGAAGTSPEYRHAMGLALVDGIAAIAQVPPDGRLEGLGRLDGYLERQVERWASQLEGYAQYDGWPGPAELGPVDRIGRWLDDHLPDDFKPGLMHGDYHVANVLYRRDAPGLAAILDWEMATLGDPLLDLARLTTAWPDANNIGLLSLKVEPWDGWPSAIQLVDRYAERTGRSMDALPWFEVLACYKFALILEGTYARACSGLAEMTVARRLHASAVGLIARAAATVGAN
ncbi:phosphotransferase family protein [Sphingobium sp. DEHP117]|uniref:phosphotransferase family protein n=1 Tax=Sphingobium sp. DEHP117 TaxID=2993436 RepID=UPI0027D71629|nr:phosphotransferase [Sphingobium sp. DEHP117]MDQ4421558.1 phosphotransferase family protein [Sphingobium sp. DEHP117]